MICKGYFPFASSCAVMLMMLFYACGPSFEEKDQEWNDSLIAGAMTSAQPGDILLRAGKSYASQQIMQLSETSKIYSHVGIVMSVNGELKVCSIEPVDETSPTDSIRYDDPYVYLDPAHNSSFALYRYDMNESERSRFVSIIERYYKKGVVFDPVFEYETDDRMYCSEMLGKALDKATNGRIQLEKTIITHPSAINSIVRHFKKYGLTKEQISKRPVILIDDVYSLPECKMIKNIHFRP